MTQIQEQMKKLGIKQVDMIFKLRERGIAVQPPEMSSIIRGITTYPKSKRILEECEKIRQYELENFIHLYKAYKALRGNSFVDKIYKEVMTWKVVT